MQNVNRIADLKHKEIINLYNGMRLGYVADVEMDIENGNIMSIIVLGELRFFGLLGRGSDIVIPWDKIDKIGDDIILINFEYISTYEPKKLWFNMKM